MVCKRLTRSQIISYTLFDLIESNQFKFIFTMNHGSKVWFSYDLTEQKKSVYRIEITVLRSLCFWQQNHNILPEFSWTYRCTLSTSQGSSCCSSVHKVYAEFWVWMYDSMHFSKIHFLTWHSSYFIINPTYPTYWP